jgi:hypothetical protein
MLFSKYDSFYFHIGLESLVYHICSFCNDTVNNTDYIASNDRMTLNYELKLMLRGRNLT